MCSRTGLVVTELSNNVLTLDLSSSSVSRGTQGASEKPPIFPQVDRCVDVPPLWDKTRLEGSSVTFVHSMEHVIWSSSLPGCIPVPSGEAFWEVYYLAYGVYVHGITILVASQCRRYLVGMCEYGSCRCWRGLLSWSLGSSEDNYFQKI